MKILFITHEFPPIGGGGANACFYLSKEFCRMGHEIDIITANFEGMESAMFVNGATVYRVDSVRKKKESSNFLEMFSYVMKAIPATERLCKVKKYDICIVFFGIPSGPIGLYLKKKYSIPYIVRFGGGDVPGFQDRFKSLYKILRKSIKRIWDNADALIANSEGLRDMALAFYSKNDFLVVNNGVDSDYFRPSAYTKRDYVNILFVSRLIERKGLQYVIPHMLEIEEKSGKQVYLTVVGDGPYRDTLIDLSYKNGIQEKINFVGHKSHDEILAFYQDADMFILPSSREGMPNVVLEAMACGLPIVMTPCQGSKELVNGNGIVADIEKFSDEIINLIVDDEKRQEMGEASRHRVETDFSWARVANEYNDIISEVTSNK